MGTDVTEAVISSLRRAIQDVVSDVEHLIALIDASKGDSLSGPFVYPGHGPEPECQCCAFAAPVSEPEGAFRCRRYAPVHSGRAVAAWPLVLPRDWCGEFRITKRIGELPHYPPTR